MTGDQAEVIAFLSDPKSFGPQDRAVERHETHGSMVFLAGDFAYKLKRAVAYPYMDYSTPELRRAMCEAELLVNRRMAPNLYLGVRAIVREVDGRVRFGTADESGTAIDWVVVMRRFPQSMLLEEMRKRGELTAALMRELGEVIAAFHAAAEIKKDLGGALGVARVIEENLAVMRSYCGDPFPISKMERFAELAWTAHRSVTALLDARRDAGFVRRCHGDLHLNNICLFDGTPTMFDAIEFSDEFACIDVLYDLAFLLMDLQHHGLRDLANALLNRYLEKTGDFQGMHAMPLFLSCRAAIRAHVTAARLRLSVPEHRAQLVREAESFLDQAIAFLGACDLKLLVLSGYSGTGKSTLARLLAGGLGRAPGAVILRSDVIRKQLQGVAETARLPETGYRAEITRRVYDTLGERAKILLDGGHSVIVDAVYGRTEERREVEAVARQCRASFRGVWLDAPAPILEERLGRRRGDASDADAGVLHWQLGKLDVPAEWVHVDASGSIEENLKRLNEAVR